MQVGDLIEYKYYDFVCSARRALVVKVYDDFDETFIDIMYFSRFGHYHQAHALADNWRVVSGV
jgi:hypothetical protein